MVIAIDGPAGAGKSTVARALAERLGFTYLDSGAIEIEGSESVSGGPGFLAAFDPNERRELLATEDALLLLLLSPWPGKGHPSQPA